MRDIMNNECLFIQSNYQISVLKGNLPFSKALH